MSCLSASASLYARPVTIDGFGGNPSVPRREPPPPPPEVSPPDTAPEDRADELPDASERAGNDRGDRPGIGRALITGIALGLREVLDPRPRDKIAVEQDAPGEPAEPQRLEVHLDRGDPRESYAIYRPELEE